MALKRKSMIRVVPAARAKNNYGDLLRRVSEQNETQIVERAGIRERRRNARCQVQPYFAE